MGCRIRAMYGVILGAAMLVMSACGGPLEEEVRHGEQGQAVTQGAALAAAAQEMQTTATTMDSSSANLADANGVGVSMGMASESQDPIPIHPDGRPTSDGTVLGRPNGPSPTASSR